VIARVPLVASDEDILRISAANPGWRVERDAVGAPIMTPPTGAATAGRNAWLTSMIFEWAKEHGYFAFDSNCGFRLADTSVVAPDAALITLKSWEELPADERERFFPGAPAVAVELVSPTDSLSDLRAKLVRLRRAGTSYVVLIDPYGGTIWTDGTPPPGFDLNFEPLLG
jgi:Uma2 family endonuclease